MLGVVAPAQAVPADLDASFSGDGKQKTDFGGSGGGHDVAVQADSEILVAGETYLENPFSSSDFALARYKPDGSLDRSFSDDGRQATDFGGADLSYGLAIQADGKLVVAGYSVTRPITTTRQTSGLPATRVDRDHLTPTGPTPQPQPQPPTSTLLSTTPTGRRAGAQRRCRRA